MTTIEKSERNEMILISVQKYNYRVLLAVCIEQCVQLYMCFVAPVWLCDVLLHTFCRLMCAHAIPSSRHRISLLLLSYRRLRNNSRTLNGVPFFIFFSRTIVTAIKIHFFPYSASTQYSGSLCCWTNPVLSSNLFWPFSTSHHHFPKNLPSPAAVCGAEFVLFG